MYKAGKPPTFFYILLLIEVVNWEIKKKIIASMMFPIADFSKNNFGKEIVFQGTNKIWL